MRPLTIKTARAFNQLLQPARYKAIWGGRGGGKSHFFGEAVVEHMLLNRGAFIVCVREVQKTLAQSSKRLIEHKIADLGVGKHFKAFHDKICKAPAKVKATGTVKKVNGKNELTPTEIELVK